MIDETERDEYRNILIDEEENALGFTWVKFYLNLSLAEIITFTFIA